MKKIYLLFSVLFITLSFTCSANSKVLFPYIETKETDVKPANCFPKSNTHYRYCMLGCVSSMSPDYIIYLCVNKCSMLVNKSYFNCMMSHKYIEEEE